MKSCRMPVRITIIAIVLALGLTPLAAAAAQQVRSRPARTAPQPDSPQITELLKQAQTQAAGLEKDAHALVTFQRSNISWSTHMAQLDQMRQQINAVGKLDTQLRDARGTGSPWQQTAIDRVNPALRELADNLQATIQHANDHQKELRLPAFAELVQTNADLAEILNETIRDAVNYGQRKQEYEAAERRFVGEEGR